MGRSDTHDADIRLHYHLERRNRYRRQRGHLPPPCRTSVLQDQNGHSGE